MYSSVSFPYIRVNGTYFQEPHKRQTLVSVVP
jgi:hypothetical protein